MVGKRINIMTCGNVDDGKSTLLGRFLFETNNISIDQSAYLKRIQHFHQHSYLKHQKYQKHKILIV